MSHDIACRITLFPPVRTVFPRPGRFPFYAWTNIGKEPRTAASPTAESIEVLSESPSFVSSRIRGIQ